MGNVDELKFTKDALYFSGHPQGGAPTAVLGKQQLLLTRHPLPLSQHNLLPSPRRQKLNLMKNFFGNAQATSTFPGKTMQSAVILLQRFSVPDTLHSSFSIFSVIFSIIYEVSIRCSVSNQS